MLRRGGLLALSLSACVACSPRGESGELRTALGKTGEALVYGKERKLTASDGTENDNFGWSVGVTADVAIVTAENADVGSHVRQGAAYVYDRSGSTWTENQVLTASDADTNDYAFGSSLALVGDTAIIGSRYSDAPDTDTGAAYVYVRSGSSFVEQQKLVASDAVSMAFLGSSVAISGDTAVIGAMGAKIGSNDRQGAAYIYVRSGSSWEEQQKLTASDGAAQDWFANGVAIDGDTVLVGAAQASSLTPRPHGAVYVYVRSGSTWSEQQKLELSDAGTNDHAFGQAVALVGNTAFVGVSDQVGPNPTQGSVRVFTRSGSIWSEQQMLVAADGADGTDFGYSLALFGATLLVGAPCVSFGKGLGSAYVFAVNGSTWAEQQKLSAKDSEEGDYFGWSVALFGDTALVGSAFDDVGGIESQGSAHAYQLAPANGEPCTNDTECASEHCIDAVCCDLDCSGACAACSVATGADLDGTCKIFAAGALGAPACAPQACNGTSLDCASCAHDAECADDTYCAANGQCQAQKAAGAACDLAATADCLEEGCGACVTGHCEDQVCCDRACTTVEACRASLKLSGNDGTCGEAKTAADGSSCTSGETCTSGACQDGVCCDRACGPAEACRETLKVSGADGTCGDAKTAVDGSSCDAPDGCTSGHCVDGVCCSRACDGACEACTAALKGSGDDGRCEPIDRGLDPEAECSDDGAPSCEQTGFCDGEGACERYSESDGCEPEPCANGADCTSGFCEDEICCDRACTETEACRADLKRSGGDGTCGEARVSSNGSTCAKVDGSTCASGHCVEGVCCDRACDGECESCLGANHGAEDGTCAFALAGTDPRQLCPASEKCPLRPVCNGTGRCECNALPASCAEDGITSVALSGAKTACAPFRCDAVSGRCVERCTSGVDCAPGARCAANGECVAVGSTDSATDGGCGCRLTSPVSPANGRASVAIGWLMLCLVGGRRRARVQARS